MCVISADGSHIVHSHVGQPGSDIGLYNVPRHLTLDDNESVFVADCWNSRVTLLSPSLEFVRKAVSRDVLKEKPWRLYLDTRHRLLYVAVNLWKISSPQWKGGESRGHVAAFSV